jgi:CDP-paratose 2-epimerase
MHHGKHMQKSNIQSTTSKLKPVLITGGSGFVGANLAQRLLAEGRQVVLFDNLSRPGVEANARWLAEEYGSRVQLVFGDVRDGAKLRDLVGSASAVFHFAAQVAVTTSLLDPLHDFEVNVRGTLNVLEAMRRLKRPPPLLYTSTNKVYGSLPDVPMVEQQTRYAPRDEKLRATGIGEERPLDFHSPYGCSKGAADQYVIDYARSFGLPATVFRMSCIYGPRQFGTEDQGWVAHFLIRAAARQPITIYGDGKQVRDILFVGDLVDAMLRAESEIDQVAGHAFNIGGGPGNVISLVELLEQIEALVGHRPALAHEDWRTGDQRYYVSDTSKFERFTGWRPQVSVRDGLAALAGWLTQQNVMSQSDVPRVAHGGAKVAQAGAAS